MIKKEFDLKYKNKIISGEATLKTRDGRPVRILCWDGNYETGNILADVPNNQTDSDKNIAIIYDDNGHSRPRNVHWDLIVVIDMPDALPKHISDVFEEEQNAVIVRENPEGKINIAWNLESWDVQSILSKAFYHIKKETNKRPGSFNDCGTDEFSVNHVGVDISCLILNAFERDVLAVIREAELIGDDLDETGTLASFRNCLKKLQTLFYAEKDDKKRNDFPIPKFSIGDYIINKKNVEIGLMQHGFHITDIRDGLYWEGDGTLPIADQNEWAFVSSENLPFNEALLNICRIIALADMDEKEAEEYITSKKDYLFAAARKDYLKSLNEKALKDED